MIPNPIEINNGTILSVDSLQELTGTLAVDSGGASLLPTFSTKNLWVHGAWNGSGDTVIDDWQANSSDLAGGLVLVDSTSNAYSGTITINPPSTGFLGGVLEIGNNTALINASIFDKNTSTAGLLFTVTAPQIGSLAGTGNIALPSGGLTAGGNGGSTTYGGVLSGNGGFTKAGGGAMILSGNNTYNGATSVTGGVLEITGSIGNTSAITVSPGAVLFFSGAAPGAASAVTNNGTVKVSGSVALSGTGTFTNNGVLDLINASQTLPKNLINHGVVLNAGSVQVQQAAITAPNTFLLTVTGYAQHNYQLQQATSLTAPIAWTNVGAAQTGLGSTLTFKDTGASAATGFYRIQVSP